jgi:hypothetical protein
VVAPKLSLPSPAGHPGSYAPAARARPAGGYDLDLSVAVFRGSSPCPRPVRARVGRRGWRRPSDGPEHRRCRPRRAGSRRPQQQPAAPDRPHRSVGRVGGASGGSSSLLGSQPPIAASSAGASTLVTTRHSVVFAGPRGAGTVQPGEQVGGHISDPSRTRAAASSAEPARLAAYCAPRRVYGERSTAGPTCSRG